MFRFQENLTYIRACIYSPITLYIAPFIENCWNCISINSDYPAIVIYLIYTGNPLNPSPPTYKQLAALVSIAGVQDDSTDNKSLAILTFLFLYAAIIGTSDG